MLLIGEFAYVDYYAYLCTPKKKWLAVEQMTL